MGKIKAILIVGLRQQGFAKADNGKLGQFLASLTPEEKNFFEAALPSTRIPLDQAIGMIVKAVNVLYPNNREAWA